MKIGWKKVYFITNGIKYAAIVKLQILGRVVKPHRTVSLVVEGQSQYVPKYRTSKARVLNVSPTTSALQQMRIDGVSVENWDKIVFEAHSGYKYYNGKTCVPQEKFDDNPDNDCSSGIHFFDRKCEAQAW